MGETGLHPGGIPYRRKTGSRLTAWALVLLVHGLIIAAWLNQRAPLPMPRLAAVALNLLADETPPPPPPREEPPRKPLPRPAVAPRAETPAPPARPLPPAPTAVHRPDDQEWIAPAQVDAGPVARRAPSEYAHQVKARVISQVVYPKGAVYPTPAGFKGDPRMLMRECTIAYELVVDRQGRLVSYELDPCQDDLLGPAAEAAILKGQPYPPPPEGAEQYRIYGSINFKKPKLGP